MNTEIERIYDGIRRAERRAQAQRTETAYRRAPELAALEQERRDVFASAAAKRLGADEAAERFSRLDARERKLLAQAGLPADTLSLHYRCEVCRDTGYVGGASRRPCGCRLLLAAKLDHLVIVTNNVFEDGISYDAGTMAYLRALGRINAALVKRADRVVEVVVGIPVILKEPAQERTEE